MGRLMYKMYRPLNEQEMNDSISCSMKTDYEIVLCRSIEMPKAVVELIEMEITSCNVTKEERQELMDFLDSVLVKEEEDAH